MLVILVGKSGSGKSTVIQKLKKDGFSLCPGYTTRPPRPNDDKISISEEEFKQMLNEFIEYVNYNGYYYGRKKSDVLKAKDENVVVDLEPYGITNYIEFCKQNNIPYLVVYLKCDDSVRLNRIDAERQVRDDSYFDSFLSLYDLIIDTSRFNPDQITSIILTASKTLNISTRNLK